MLIGIALSPSGPGPVQLVYILSRPAEGMDRFKFFKKVVHLIRSRTSWRRGWNIGRGLGRRLRWLFSTFLSRHPCATAGIMARFSGPLRPDGSFPRSTLEYCTMQYDLIGSLLGTSPGKAFIESVLALLKLVGLAYRKTTGVCF